MSRNHLATQPSQTSELFSQRSFVIPVLKVNRRHYSHKLNLVEILKNFFGTTSWKKKLLATECLLDDGVFKNSLKNNN